MRLFAALVLIVLLLRAPGAVAADFRARDGRALCLNAHSVGISVAAVGADRRMITDLGMGV